MRFLFILFVLFLSINTSFGQFKPIQERPMDLGNTPKLLLDKPVHIEQTKMDQSKSYDFSAIPSNLQVIKRNQSTISPVFIESRLVSSSKNLSRSGRIQYLFDHHSNDLRIKGSETNFEIISEKTDELGMNHLRFKQTFNGIPVYGAELLIHIDTDEKVVINGRIAKAQDTKIIEPAISSEEAKALVRATIEKERNFVELNAKDKDFFNVSQWKEDLVWYDDPVGSGSLLLAWHLQVYSDLINRWEYFIDARSGEVIKAYSSICKFHNHNHESKILDGPESANGIDLSGISRSFEVYNVGVNYFMIDASRNMYNAAQSVMPDEPVGVIWTLDANNTSPENSDFSVSQVTTTGNNWSGRSTAVSAHYNAGLAYEYFKNTFNRESINGNGGNIISVVNVTESSGGDMDNAFWNGIAMFYGNGDVAFDKLAKALDVSTHELSHGVVQTTANLEYFGESGALNEAFADIFGVMVDRDDWKIGEDVVNTNFFPSGALRDLQNPHNGAATNDFSGGWQPQKYSERFTGSQDNNGVHINSGIPNHAFFLFATAVGKDKAEQVFYRALTTYLVKSSQFVDLRNAVQQAAADLYGQPEVDAAKVAFDTVEIPGGEGGNYEEEVIENPGEDFVIFSDEQRSSLILATAGGTVLANPLSSQDPISRPSVTDNGEIIVYVASDNHIYRIDIDWENNMFAEERLSSAPEWSNVAISKDGSMIGGVLNTSSPIIWVFNLEQGNQKSFTLENPTSADGVSTGDVIFADAMEFDFTNEWIIYDAANRISGNSGEDIEYWDIGFVNVWDNTNDDYASGRISKLFSGLPENVSIGNPTFSSNAPFIIAFDVIELVDEINNIFDFSIWGANIETLDVAEIFSNTTLGYPSYSRDDTKMIYNFETVHLDVGVSDLENNRIEGVPNTESILLPQAGWAVWFSNGIREFNTPVFEVEEPIESINVYPNPSFGAYTIEFEWKDSGIGSIEIFDMMGKSLKISSLELINGLNRHQVDLGSLPEGNYLLKIRAENKIDSRIIGKY